MKPRARRWHDIAEPYRAEAWPECARIARALVDQDPYDVATRALLASLLVRTRQRPLALMQYERLLPLAVGQGNLFLALAMQRRLDDLMSAAERHPDRYRAIHDWFRALAGTAPSWGGTAGRELSPSSLLDLPPEAFAVVAERAGVLPLGMAPQVLREGAGLLWVVYLGRIRWTLVSEGDSFREERIAEEGDVIHLPAGDPAARWIEIAAETPAEVLQFDPGLPAMLGPPPAPAQAADRADAGTPSGGPDARTVADASAAQTAAPPPAPPAMPRPDPVAEPTLAVGAPRDRRRDTRMRVSLGNRAALLGEAGTRLAPLHGQVFDISLTGLGLCFPAGEIRHSPGIRPNAFVTMQVVFDDSDERLEVTGRIAWIELEPRAEEREREVARLGLEFVAVSPEVRARLVHLLDSAARAER